MSRAQLVREGTTVDDMLRVVSDEIVAGKWPPGAKLDAQGFARRFAVSRTPVREMFGHLSAMGLVERRPNRGVVVASITDEDLGYLFEAMAELEATCARFCALRMTTAEREALRRVHQESAELVSANLAEEYEAFNRKFHNLLYAGSHSPYLQELAVATRTRLQPFRRAQFFLVSRPAHSHVEHDAIVNAILASDGEKAAEATRAHVMQVRSTSQAFVDSHRYPNGNGQQNPEQSDTSG